MTAAKKAAAKKPEKDRGPGPEQAVTHTLVMDEPAPEPVEED